MKINDTQVGGDDVKVNGKANPKRVPREFNMPYTPWLRSVVTLYNGTCLRLKCDASEGGKRSQLCCQVLLQETTVREAVRTPCSATCSDSAFSTSSPPSKSTEAVFDVINRWLLRPKKSSASECVVRHFALLFHTHTHTLSLSLSPKRPCRIPPYIISSVAILPPSSSRDSNSFSSSTMSF